MHAPKLAMVFPVRFAHAQRVEQTTAREVSVEGIFVRCQQPPRAGVQVSLKLYLPDQPQTADLVGVVRGPGEGMSESGFWADFVRPDPIVHGRLRALLSHLLVSPDGAPKPARAQAARPSTAPSRPLPGPKESAENRRVFPRYPARFAVHLSQVQDFVREYAANLSAGGAFVVTQTPPELGALILVVLELPGGGVPVACKACVVHRVTPEQAQARGTEAGAGVQFIEVDAGFQARIDQALEQIRAAPRQ